MNKERSNHEVNMAAGVYNLYDISFIKLTDSSQEIMIPGLPQGVTVYIGRSAFHNATSIPDRTQSVNLGLPQGQFETDNLLKVHTQFLLEVVIDGIVQADRPLHVIFIDDVTPNSTFGHNTYSELAHEEPRGIAITIFIPLSKSPEFISSGLIPDQTVIFAARRDHPKFLSLQEGLINAGIFEQSDMKMKARNKVAFKNMLLAAGIPTPKLLEIEPGIDISEALKQLILSSSEHTAYIKDPYANNGTGIIQISLTDDGNFLLRIPRCNESPDEPPQLLVLNHGPFSQQIIQKIYTDHGYALNKKTLDQLYIEEGVKRLYVGDQGVEIRVNMTLTAFTYRLRLLPNKDDYRANQCVGGTTIEGAGAIREFLATADQNNVLQQQIESAIRKLHKIFASNLPELLKNGQSIDVLVHRQNNELVTYVIETQGLEPDAGLLPQLARDEMAARKEFIMRTHSSSA